MKPTVDHLLYLIVDLPEYESIPADDADAIRYMSQWDYGEYHEQETLSQLYEARGRIRTQNGYVLFRPDYGGASLYRLGPTCQK